MKFIQYLSYSPRILLFVLPVFFFITTILIHYSSGPFYLLTVDPEYFHLLSGINLAIFNLATPNTAHPATTIQIAYALASLPINTILPGSLVENVINHPELFIHATSILITMIISGLLFWFGRVVHQLSGSLFAALLVQLVPYGSSHQFLSWGRIMPESFVIIPIILLMAYSLRYLHQSKTKETTIIHVRIFALIIALSIATKFSYFPLLLVPFIILPTWRFKIRFLVLSVMFSLLFAFPILFNLTDTFKWLFNMFISSGKWGGGSATFIDWGAVPQRLEEIGRYDRSLNYITIILMVMCATILIFRKKINQAHIVRKSQLYISFVLAIILFTALVVKHFSIHYLIPILSFKLFFVFLITDLITTFLKPYKHHKWWYAPGFIAGLFFVVSTFISSQNSIPNRIKRVDRLNDQKLQINQAIKPDIPILISSYYWGSPFPEKALADAFLVSGKLKFTFQQDLMKRFPNSYFYFDWGKRFYFWDKFLNPKDFIEPGSGAFLYLVNRESYSLDTIIGRMHRDFPEFYVEAENLLEFQDPEESLYFLSFNKKK